MRSRPAVLLTPSIAARCPGLLAQWGIRSVQRMSPAGRKNLLNAPYLTGGPGIPFLTSLPHYFLSPSSLSPLAATLMDPPASVANKRLTVWLNPLDATLTKNTGGGGDGGHSSQFRNS